MLQQWDREQPGRVDQIARALGDVRPEQLADRTLFDFLGLGGGADAPLPDAAGWLAGSAAEYARD